MSIKSFIFSNITKTIQNFKGVKSASSQSYLVADPLVSTNRSFISTNNDIASNVI